MPSLLRIEPQAFRSLQTRFRSVSHKLFMIIYQYVGILGGGEMIGAQFVILHEFIYTQRKVKWLRSLYGRLSCIFIAV